MYGCDDVLLWYTEINNNGNEDSLIVVVKGVSGTDEDALYKSLEQELQKQFQISLTVEGSSLDAITNKTGLEKFITEQVVFDNRNS